MPFIRGDIDGWDVDEDEIDSDEGPETLDDSNWDAFTYQAASARFEPQTLGPVSRVMLEALKEVGATQHRVRYDGGFDEGFAYPESLTIGDQVRPVQEVLPEITKAELVERIRAASTDNSMWGNASQMYAEASPEQVSAYALDELATELAMLLLGQGYGTGEYELYGAFTASLITGAIEDDPNAVKLSEGD